MNTKKAFLLYDMTILTSTQKRELCDYIDNNIDNIEHLSKPTTSKKWKGQQLSEGMLYETTTPDHYIIRIFVMSFYYTYLHVYIEIPSQYMCQDHLFTRLPLEWKSHRFSHMIRAWLPEFPSLFLYDFFTHPAHRVHYHFPTTVDAFFQNMENFLMFLKRLEQLYYQKQKQQLVQQLEEELIQKIWHPKRFFLLVL